jgi:hypothetical protein
MYRSHFAAGIAVMTAAVVDATCAHATLKVGGAVVVERNVIGSMTGEQPIRMYKGSDVYEYQTIRSEAESSAQLRFMDSTIIPIGPTTSLKIDRFVVNPDQSVRQVLISVGQGAIRWTSGTSVSSAYEIRTPTGQISVKGTTFDLFVEARKTTVVLRDGSVGVCSIEARRCQSLSGRDDMAIATPSGVEVRLHGPGSAEFASECLSARSRRCMLASVDPNPPTQDYRSPSPRQPKQTRPPQKQKQTQPQKQTRRYVLQNQTPPEEVIIIPPRRTYYNRPAYYPRYRVYPRTGYGYYGGRGYSSESAYSGRTGSAYSGRTGSAYSGRTGSAYSGRTGSAYSGRTGSVYSGRTGSTYSPRARVSGAGYVRPRTSYPTIR